MLTPVEKSQRYQENFSEKKLALNENLKRILWLRASEIKIKSMPKWKRRYKRTFLKWQEFLFQKLFSSTNNKKMQNYIFKTSSFVLENKLHVKSWKLGSILTMMMSSLTTALEYKKIKSKTFLGTEFHKKSSRIFLSSKFGFEWLERKITFQNPWFKKNFMVEKVQAAGKIKPPLA